MSKQLTVADYVVRRLARAAAEVLAEGELVEHEFDVESRGKALGVKLGRGVSADVKDFAKKVAEKGGPEALRKVAKLHFRTAHEVAPAHFAAPVPPGAARVYSVDSHTFTGFMPLA